MKNIYLLFLASLYCHNIIIGSEIESDDDTTYVNIYSDSDDSISTVSNTHEFDHFEAIIQEEQESLPKPPYTCPSCISISVIKSKRMVRDYCTNPCDNYCRNTFEPQYGRPCIQTCMHGVKFCYEKALEPICSHAIIPSIRAFCYTMSCQWWNDIQEEDE